MTILVTGAAGFIGYHLCDALLRRGHIVVGVDNLNDYYSPALKQARLARLTDHRNFRFRGFDIAEAWQFDEALADESIDHIVHLAAQAGVRYSIDNPAAYVSSNLVGHCNILEFARRLDGLKHCIYASSSSVYGGRTDLPFAEGDRADHPVSLYAATKKADELMSETYAHLYDIPLTGLRFFTVYGPWGRPDMAYFTFTKAIFDGSPIKIYNQGNMGRDFTYIDDIVTAICAMLDTPPRAGRSDQPGGSQSCHAIYNIGNNQPARLTDFVNIIESATGRSAVREYHPMQPGDVKETYADISAIQRDFGFQPSTDLAIGIGHFVDWYRQYYAVGEG